VAAANPEVVRRIEEYLKTARTADENYPLLTPAEGRKRRQERLPSAGATNEVVRPTAR
jgi:hypothetical protein